MSPLWVCWEFLLLKLVSVCSLSGNVAGKKKIVLFITCLKHLARPLN